ncbi:hypothetical protein B7P43_G04874 [Cryptotermes secundus]|uniref:Mitochondrial assembly of ribosomal large subunit protein 1 n=1 Tax=Cryptotermes secundus TaxID=105785 RepID=A0A2J7QV06_9NEOP|nr:uncharacterized protein LOC111865208 isoform X2 [Cryptotermes secundus]PNF32411.1 hypothetical protein B7P43_G04874 [Cryptotermes secundus]
MITLRNCGIRSAKSFESGRNLYQVYSQRVLFSRLYQVDSEKGNKENGKKHGFSISEQIPSAISSKYQVFRDEDATVILDVEEERLKHLQTLELPQEQDKEDEFSDLNLERGVHGVFDIEEIVHILRREKLEDLFVVAVPQDIKYVDYIVIVTGKSKRQMSAVAEFVRKLYKRKRHQYDLIPRIEGQNSKDWMALDLDIWKIKEMNE